MTVHRLLRKETAGNRPASQRMHAASARRLLAVTPAAACRAAARRDAAGTRNRLRALTALGHPATSLAARAGAAPCTIRDLLNGRTATVNPRLHAAVAALYDQLWDTPPDTRTGAQRRAAAASRDRAAANGWPAPMGLDDDRIDDPAYRPRAHWRPAAASFAPPSAPARTGPGKRPGDRSASARGCGRAAAGE